MFAIDHVFFNLKNKTFRVFPFGWAKMLYCYYINWNFFITQFSSVAQLSPTFCNPMDCSMPDLPVPHLSKIAHVHVIESVMSSNHLILWCPLLLCPQLFPTLGTFPISELFASGDQNTGVSTSASVPPMSIQSGFPLRLTGLISLLSSGLSGVFSSITVRRHQFFGILPSLRFTSNNPTWPLGRP